MHALVYINRKNIQFHLMQDAKFLIIMRQFGFIGDYNMSHDFNT